jgi:hypothetical protein
MAFHEELHPDVELVPKNGPPIHAHRVVMVCSPPFYNF